MLIELPVGWTILSNAFGCLTMQLGWAWLFTQLPVRWFEPPPERAWEIRGRIYERVFTVKNWKDRLPDGARLFSGGFAKKSLPAITPESLARFIRETWRAELCHFMTIACTPVFLIWNPWWSEGIIVAYALAANLPCIIAQRYNRGRMRRLLAAATARLVINAPNGC